MDNREERRTVGGLRLHGRIWGRPLYWVEEPLPLVGVVAFGVIDRGTNVLQVRPTTLCPLSCIFCSVDAGPRSRHRQAEYLVEAGWLVEWVERVAREKQVTVEALIDGVGDPLTYPRIVDLVSMLKKSPLVHTVAVETHGAPLSRQLVDRLEEAGLDRVNLSIDTLNPGKARLLTGSPWYDVERVKMLAEYIARETSIDLHVTPVWLPGINDEDVEEVVKWALRIGAGKKWPPATVQKYLRHRYGRNPPGVREPSWREFHQFLERLEEKTGTRLRQEMSEWGMRYAKRLPEPYRVGQLVELLVVGPGWLRGEKLAVTPRRDRLVTLVSARNARPGEVVVARILRSKDNIYLAKP